MSMKLHSKLGSFLRVKTEILERLQSKEAVNGSTLFRRVAWRLTLAAAW